MEALGLFREQYRLSEKELQMLLDQMHKVSFSKYHKILSAGSRDRCLYLITEGIVRASVILPDGFDATYWFVVPGNLLFSSWGYVNNQPSQVGYETMTDVEAFVVSRHELESLYATSLAFANLGRKLMEQSCLLLDQNLLNYERPTAKERYENLISVYPQIIKEVPLQYIASYLRITPQSLSRIRAEIRLKK
ncbi:MAG: Crp/Fnr family transcriptional regulator [Bacteroidales bacterium]